VKLQKYFITSPYLRTSTNAKNASQNKHKITNMSQFILQYPACLSCTHFSTTITALITFSSTLLDTTYKSIFHDSLQSKLHFDLSSQHVCLSSSTFLFFVRFSYSDPRMFCFSSANVKCYLYGLLLKSGALCVPFSISGVQKRVILSL
jgi:hypothetical protein